MVHWLGLIKSLPPPRPASLAVKHSECVLDSAALAEQLKEQSEWEAMEVAIEAQFEVVR